MSRKWGLKTSKTKRPPGVRCCRTPARQRIWSAGVTRCCRIRNGAMESVNPGPSSIVPTLRAGDRGSVKARTSPSLERDSVAHGGWLPGELGPAPSQHCRRRVDAGDVVPRPREGQQDASGAAPELQYRGPRLTGDASSLSDVKRHVGARRIRRYRVVEGAEICCG